MYHLYCTIYILSVCFLINVSFRSTVTLPSCVTFAIIFGLTRCISSYRYPFKICHPVSTCRPSSDAADLNIHGRKSLEFGYVQSPSTTPKNPLLYVTCCLTTRWCFKADVAYRRKNMTWMRWRVGVFIISLAALLKCIVYLRLQMFMLNASLTNCR